MQMKDVRIESMLRFEDADVIVVHKPPFLAVETGNPRQQDLVSLLKNRRSSRGEEAYIGLVHRLDQPVEGLLVLAKTPRAAGLLGASLAAGDFAKEYLAAAMGVTPEGGTLVHTLKRDGRLNRSRVVGAGTPGGKEARLSYERLAVAEERSLLAVRLLTGRHHQIRVQLAAVSHPLCGDEKYGARAAQIGAGAKHDTRGIQKIPPALCSSRLVFAHPVSGARMEFCARPTGAGFAPFSAAIEEWLARQKTKQND